MAKKNWKQGRSVTIDTEVEVDIDEHLEYASTECLIEEISGRDIDFTKDVVLDMDVKIRLLTSGMSINQADAIKTAIIAITGL